MLATYAEVVAPEIEVPLLVPDEDELSDELPLLDEPELEDPELLEPDDDEPLEELPDEEDPLDESDDVNVYLTYGTNIFELE